METAHDKVADVEIKATVKLRKIQPTTIAGWPLTLEILDRTARFASERRMVKLTDAKDVIGLFCPWPRRV
jgi:hypothetical protein